MFFVFFEEAQKAQAAAEVGPIELGQLELVQLWLANAEAGLGTDGRPMRSPLQNANAEDGRVRPGKVAGKAAGMKGPRPDWKQKILLPAFLLNYLANAGNGANSLPPPPPALLTKRLPGAAGRPQTA